jgi:hypothetical protein
VLRRLFERLAVAGERLLAVPLRQMELSNQEVDLS